MNYLLDFSKRYKIVIGSRQISQIFFDHKEGNKFFLESEFKINEMICELRNIWNEKLIEFTFAMTWFMQESFRSVVDRNHFQVHEMLFLWTQSNSNLTVHTKSDVEIN